MPTNDELTGSNMSLIRREGRLLRRIVAVAVLAIVMFIAGGDAVLADNHQFLLCSGPGETVRADGTPAQFSDYIIVVNSRNFNAITDADDQVPEDTITEDDVESSGGSWVRPDLSWGMWIPSGYVYEEQGTGTCVINLKLMMREKGSNYFKEAAVEFDPLPPCQGRLWLNTTRPTGVAADVCPTGAPTTTSGVTPTDEETDTSSGDTTQSDDLPGETENPGETVTDSGGGKPGDTSTPTPPGGNGGNGGNGGGNGGNTGGNDGNTGGNDGNTGGNDGNTGNTGGNDGNTSGNTGGNGGNTGGNDGNTGGNDGNTGENDGNTGGNDGNTGGNDGTTTGGGSPGDTGSGDGDGSGSQTPTDSSRPDDDSTDQSNADMLETEGDGSGSDDMMQTEAEGDEGSGSGDKQDSEKDEDQPRSTVRPDVPRTGTGGAAAQRDSDRLAIPIGVAAGTRRRHGAGGHGGQSALRK